MTVRITFNGLVQSKQNNDEAVQLLDQILNQDPQSPYEISIPLLGASLLNDNRADELEIDFFNSYGVDPTADVNEILKKIPSDRTKAAWLFGRVLVSAMERGKDPSKIAQIIEALLEGQPNDCFAAWAWGYLAIYDPSRIPNMLESIKALSSKDDEKGKDNVPWAIVMGLQSVSDEDYEKLLSDLCKFTERSSVVEALQTIPAEDFRAWAMSLTLKAARKMNDTATCQQLVYVMDKEISSSPSPGDQMLALINYR